MPASIKCTKCNQRLYTASPSSFHAKKHEGCGGTYYTTHSKQGTGREVVTLPHVSEATRKKVEDILNNPAVHNFTKLIIREGLGRDCVDASYDAASAADILRGIMQETLKLIA